MKHATIIFYGVLIVMLLGVCLTKYKPYKSGKENEQKALDFMSSNYGIECQIISSWAGKKDFIVGRQPDVYVMKEITSEAFPFRVEVFGDKITNYYPCSFMGNEISKNILVFLQSKYARKIDKITCNSYVNTDEDTLLTSLTDINSLTNRDVEVCVYLVSTDSVEVQENILYEVFNYLQNSFTDFRLNLYFLNVEDYQAVEEYLSDNVKMIDSFESMNIQPISMFEYYKSNNSYQFERSEIISKLKVMQ